MCCFAKVSKNMLFFFKKQCKKQRNGLRKNASFSFLVQQLAVWTSQNNYLMR